MKERFKKLRKALGLSQNQLEDILELKTDPAKKSSAITKYERGEIQPSAQVLKKFASDDFNQKTGKRVNINWLLTGEGGDDNMFLSDAPVPVPRSDPATRGDVADLKGDLRAGLQEISKKLDALVQFPGEAALEKKPPAEPLNPWKDKVISLIKKANERKDPLFSTKQKKPKVALPVGAGKQYVTLEDLFSEEDVEIDWPEKVDYLVTVNGNSMEPFILDGSDIYVRNGYQEAYNNGDIAVVHVDDKQEYMVRRLWFHQRDNIIDIGLQSENPKGIEWHFWKDTEDESTYSMVKLLGKVVGPER